MTVLVQSQLTTTWQVAETKGQFAAPPVEWHSLGFRSHSKQPVAWQEVSLVAQTCWQPSIVVRVLRAIHGQPRKHSRFCWPQNCDFVTAFALLTKSTDSVKAVATPRIPMRIS